MFAMSWSRRIFNHDTCWSDRVEALAWPKGSSETSQEPRLIELMIACQRDNAETLGLLIKLIES
jgi:hypothetical protein